MILADFYTFFSLTTSIRRYCAQNPLRSACHHPSLSIGTYIHLSVHPAATSPDQWSSPMWLVWFCHYNCLRFPPSTVSPLLDRTSNGHRQSICQLWVASWQFSVEAEIARKVPSKCNIWGPKMLHNCFCCLTNNRQKKYLA